MRSFLVCLFILSLCSPCALNAEWKDVSLWKKEIDIQKCDYRLHVTLDEPTIKGTVSFNFPMTQSTVYKGENLMAAVPAFDIPTIALSYNPGLLESLLFAPDGETHDLIIEDYKNWAKENIVSRFTYVRGEVRSSDGYFNFIAEGFRKKLTSTNAIAGSTYQGASEYGNPENVYLQENCPNSNTYKVGDANKDGIVNHVDGYIILANLRIFDPEKNMNREGVNFFNKSWEDGDFDADGDVDYNDFFRWYIGYTSSAGRR